MEVSPRVSRPKASNLLVQWSDYASTNSFYFNDSPSSNYEAGAYFMRTMIALSLSDRSSVGPQLVAQVEAFRNDYIKPLLTAPTASEAGGFWAEGWNYGALATQNILVAGQGIATAGDAQEAPGLAPLAEESQWASDVITTLISSQPTPTTVYDGGDGYSYPEPFPDDDLITVLAAEANSATARSYANYILQDRSDGSTPDYLSLILGNPTAPASFWSAAPLAHLAQGQGLVTARADWSYQSTWLSFQLGNLVQADHQTDTPGMLEIQRRGRCTLDQPASLGGNHRAVCQGRIQQLRRARRQRRRRSELSLLSRTLVRYARCVPHQLRGHGELRLRGGQLCRSVLELRRPRQRRLGHSTHPRRRLLASELDRGPRPRWDAPSQLRQATPLVLSECSDGLGQLVGGDRRARGQLLSPRPSRMSAPPHPSRNSTAPTRRLPTRRATTRGKVASTD